jgi:hypothetical protein
MKFTFKTNKATGMYRSFYPNTHIIKLNKLNVGEISDNEPYKIRLQIMKKDLMEDKNPNCDWRWITLKTPSFNELQEAKDWLNKNITGITTKWELKGLD